jgi:hypothetical protein
MVAVRVSVTVRVNREGVFVVTVRTFASMPKRGSGMAVVVSTVPSG